MDGGHQEEGRPGADAAGPVLVPLGRRVDVGDGRHLLLLVFYHGGMVFAGRTATGLVVRGARCSIVVTFARLPVYDALINSPVIATRRPRTSSSASCSWPRSSSS